MKYLFHPDAENELNIAIDYYEECKKGLGIEFAKEIQKTIQRIIQFPNAWHKFDKNPNISNQPIRRCLTNRFPFGIVYYQKEDSIIILAVMQLNREPNYWKNRV